MDKLGDYIKRVKEVIPYDKNIPVKGLSVDKCFVETHITNLDRIKVPFQLVKKNQFAYVPVTSRNGDKLSLAFNSDLDKIQISTTYVVFQIINQELLNCFYLELFFKKSWIDKVARYSSTGSVRESLSFENLSWILISVPPLEKQERIVNKYQTITKYIELKKRINELFEKQMAAYYHILFDNLTNYTIKNFGELFTIVRGGRPPRGNREQEEKYFCKGEGIPWLQVKDVTKQKCKFPQHTSEQLTQEGFKRGKCKIVSSGSIIFVAGSGMNAKALGFCMVSFCDLVLNTTLWGIIGNAFAGGAPLFLLLIFTFWLKKIFPNLKKWLIILQSEFHLISRDFWLLKSNFPQDI